MDSLENIIQELQEINAKIFVDGENLRIDSEKGAIHNRLKQLIKTHKKSLINYVNQARNSIFSNIPAIKIRPHYPLSSSQRRLWILNRFDEANTAYHVSGRYVLEGDLDREALSYAFDTLIGRHESLRTVLKTDELGEVRQFILAPEETGFRIGYLDLRREEDPEAAIKKEVQAVLSKTFDLTRGPLIRAGLYQVSERKWVLVYVLHHIVSDGWSMGILMRELLLFYNVHIRGEANPLPPLRIQYKDYAAWQQEQLTGGALQEHKAYWLEQLSGELPVLELPVDKPRPAIKTYNGGVVRRGLGQEVKKGIRAISEEQGGTLFMGLLAAVNVLLYRYTGQKDIIIGSPIAGREHADLEGQIGFYLNALALRARFSESDSYRSLTEKIRQLTLAAYEHQAYPFDELLEALQLQRDMSRSPLFDVLIDFHETAMAADNDRQPGGLAVSAYEAAEHVVSKFALTFMFIESAGDLTLSLEYNSDLYEKETIERMLGHFSHLLTAMVAEPSLPVSQLTYIGEEERGRLLASFQAGAPEALPYESVLTLFARQVARCPDNVAVRTENGSLTYRELDEKAGRLAAYLQQQYEVRADELIGIMLDRSEYLLLAILGILKAGGAYVPIDAGYPTTRKEYILQDTGIRVLLTQTAYLFELPWYGGDLFAMDVQLDAVGTAGTDRAGTPRDMMGTEPIGTALDKAGNRVGMQPDTAGIQSVGTGLADSYREVQPAPEDLAYVLYTSGSTGFPKGCAITHRNLSNYIQWANDYYFGASGAPHFGLYTALSFDLTVTSLFCPLTQGGTLFVYPQGQELSRILEHSFSGGQGIDSIKLTPSHIHYLKGLELKASAIRCAIVGGEEVTPEQVTILKSINPAMRIYNEYGPTEATVGCVVKELEENTVIRIGRPIRGARIYILDEQGELCATGIAGEICIGGAGVAREYLNRPGLTAEKFVGDPFREGERMYKTGDLGRWLANGELSFLGRKDEQVKIRGYRIEVGEIENTLQSHPEIDAAVVVVRQSREGEKELVAYVVGRGALTTAGIRAHLSRTLPVYTLPSHYVMLSSLPLTVNGKVDKKQLPDPEGLDMGTGVAYIAPRTALEEKLVGLWEEILGREKVGVRDNFFDLGGHSLKATRLASQIHKIFDVRVELKDLFVKAILEEQAQLIAQAQKNSFIGISPVPLQPHYPLSPSQRRLWVLSQSKESNIAYNLPEAYIFEGELNLEALDYSFHALMERHESLRTLFKKDENGEPRQFIYSSYESGFSITYLDLRNHEGQHELLKASIQASFIEPFDLSTGPLLRASVYQTENNKWVFSYVMHHVTRDGWSKGILMRELLLFYNAYIRGEANPLPPLRIQYKDYAAWQQEQLTGDALQAHKAYWSQQLAGELPVLELPGDRTRPAIKTYEGGIVSRGIDKKLSAGIKRLSQEQGGTLFMGLLAAVNALLYRYTGQEDIIIGTPIAGREHADLEDQIGLYLNTLALRTRFKKENTYKELLKNAVQVAMEAYEHQLYPFDDLVTELAPKRDKSRSDLFDVMIVLHNTNRYKMEARQVEKSRVSLYSEGEHVVSRFDLTFYFSESEDGLQVRIEYNSDIYNKSTVQRLIENFEQLLMAVIGHPSTPINKLVYNII